MLAYYGGYNGYKYNGYNMSIPILEHSYSTWSMGHDRHNSTHSQPDVFQRLINLFMPTILKVNSIFKQAKFGINFQHLLLFFFMISHETLSIKQ